MSKPRSFRKLMRSLQRIALYCKTSAKLPPPQILRSHQTLTGSPRALMRRLLSRIKSIYVKCRYIFKS
ncbi:hypothetical protein CPB83DRAFT_863429 [Crepidotus variabilis]|uniref:Uncharacterized protein n=1 Tax=Crepidotus variabilis TaxID=179855 RepID=A0A9P6JJM3_9AGAR|nr:hypothetical protein CPB83DRAFT_863429 [Crepidotus variabilis]